MMKALMRMVRSTDDMASCIEVLRNLDAYLDREIPDQRAARRIASHLEVCRRCGMRAETITELKASLRRLAPTVDAGALDRLRRFARSLEEQGNDY